MEVGRQIDGLRFRFVDGTLDLVRIDFRSTFVVRDGTATVEVCIETPFTVVAGKVRSSCVPENPASLAPILPLVHSQVQSVGYEASGKLSVFFKSGISIEVSPDPAFEAWQLASAGLLVVCGPGGQVSLFGHEI